MASWNRAVALALMGAGLLACGPSRTDLGALDVARPEGIVPFGEAGFGEGVAPADASEVTPPDALDAPGDVPGDLPADPAPATAEVAPGDAPAEAAADLSEIADAEVAPDLPPQPCVPYQAEDPCGPGLQCLPTAEGEGLCQPAGSVTVDGACGTGVGLCVPGHTCLLEGPAGGRCVPYCDPTAAAGDAAACQDPARTCVDLGIPSFGICLSACDPWFVCPQGQGCAPACPEGQACAPMGPEAEAGACWVVGSAGEGEACEKAGAWWACGSGLACLAEPSDAAPTCERRCRPFGPAEDCPGEGAFCLLKKTWLGLCATGALGLPAGLLAEPATPATEDTAPRNAAGGREDPDDPDDPNRERSDPDRDDP